MATGDWQGEVNGHGSVFVGAKEEQNCTSVKLFHFLIYWEVS